MRFLVLSFLLTISVFAHDDHDWRLDYEAYLNVSTDVTPGHKMLLDREPQRIDIDFLKEKLTQFARTERKTNHNLDLARTFLSEEYKKLGFEVTLQPFGSGTNLIAEKKGITNPDKVLILSSHIDSVGNLGANDNGTGTIGTLTIAKELAKKEHGHTIRILGFDREERGLLGSDAYVATLTDRNSVIGNINIEMIGFHSKNDGSFHLIDCDRPFLWNVERKESEFLSEKIINSIVTLALDLRVVKTCTRRSDHASFWRAKIPAVVLSENFFGGDPDPCYHSRCDIVDERLNYPYMAKILEAVLHTTEKLLETK